MELYWCCLIYSLRLILFSDHSVIVYQKTVYLCNKQVLYAIYYRLEFNSILLKNDIFVAVLFILFILSDYPSPERGRPVAALLSYESYFEYKFIQMLSSILLKK